MNILAAMVALVLTCSPVFAQTSKVGFVNPQRVIMESKVGRIAQEDLARMGKAKDKQIRDARDGIEAMQMKLDAGVFSVTERTAKEKEIRQAIRKYERLVDDSTLDLKNEERRLVKFIMQKADIILRRLAGEMGFTIILTDPEAIGYVADSMDITERVIHELDGMM